MAKSRDTGAKMCVCNKCGYSCHAIPSKIHRRCSGNSENNIPRKKGDLITKAERGMWV